MASPRAATRPFAAAAIVATALFISAPAAADTFRLKTGRTIEGDVEKDLGDKLVIRVAAGTLEIEKKDIESQTPGETPWRKYEKERAKYPDTAEGRYRLAQWCHKHRLRDRELQNLRRVIKLDPNHEDARLALGHVKVRGTWLDPREQRKQELKADPDRVEQDRQEQVDKLVREIVSKWFVRIKAIFADRMASGQTLSNPRFVDARKQLLAIQDPLAIPAITNVLARGSESARRVMIECLSQFLQDEATMNLLVVAVIDPSPEIRRLAAIELIPRKDDRLIDRLRDGLAAPDEGTIRNAAAALGVIRAKSAVPDLIGVLSRETRQLVQVTRPVFFRKITTTFGGGTTVRVDNQNYYYRPDRIGVVDPEVMMGTETTTELHTVSIYRTEVQEALIAITGENHGFDGDAWLKWWREHAK